MDISGAAAILGRKGGRSRSKAKVEASRENGELGGRPRKYPACPKYKGNKSHRFNPNTNKCYGCGYKRP